MVFDALMLHSENVMNTWVMIGLLEVHKVVDRFKDALDHNYVAFDHVDAVAFIINRRAKINRIEDEDVRITSRR